MSQIQYSKNFVNSFTQTITYWQDELQLPDAYIQRYTSLVSKSISLLHEFPSIYQDISSIYHFSTPTYRITIGKKYAIFYRVNEKEKKVLIGSFFNNKQMKVDF